MGSSITGIKPEDIHLILFLSRATPLTRWDKIGIFDREIELYKRLSSRLGQISIVTSGGQEELAYQENRENINILYNRWKLSPNLYSLLAPILHWRALKPATVFKTNQLDGAWTAVIAGKLHQKPVIIRTGYLWAKNFGAAGNRGFKLSIIAWLEALSFKFADAIMLTTDEMKDYVIKTHHTPPEKVTVIPNYVDTESFRPMPEMAPIKGRICFVGRLTPIKNLPLLIEAVSKIPDASLVLIGQGEQHKELEDFAQRYHVNVSFLGVIPHQKIPTEINRSEVFILPSRYEGHPKALIEAMACGAAVVGTDVEGIRSVIKNEETGLLCSPTVDDIASALRRLLTDKELRIRLGKAARAFAESEYSLNRIVETELSLLQSISSK